MFFQRTFVLYVVLAMATVIVHSASIAERKYQDPTEEGSVSFHEWLLSNSDFLFCSQGRSLSCGQK